MSYEVGQHIDLSYLNAKPAPAGQFSAAKASGNFILVGTQFLFDFVDGHIVSRRISPARHIPVVYA